MTAPDLPAPTEGFVLTHFVVSEDVPRSAAFYRDVLGGEVVLEGEPTIVKLANGWVTINSGGGPTDDKPDVVLAAPNDLNVVSAFLNIRVADIDAIYEQWTRNGATFLTSLHQSTEAPRSAATYAIPTAISSRSASSNPDSEVTDGRHDEGSGARRFRTLRGARDSRSPDTRVSILNAHTKPIGLAWATKPVAALSIVAAGLITRPVPSLVPIRTPSPRSQQCSPTIPSTPSCW